MMSAVTEVPKITDLNVSECGFSKSRFEIDGGCANAASAK